MCRVVLFTFFAALLLRVRLMKGAREDLYRRGLSLMDALIIACLEAVDSVEQLASRLGVTRQAVYSSIWRAQSRLSNWI